MRPFSCGIINIMEAVGKFHALTALFKRSCKAGMSVL